MSAETKPLCPVCNKRREANHWFWECSHVDCPNRKPVVGGQQWPEQEPEDDEPPIAKLFDDPRNPNLKG